LSPAACQPRRPIAAAALAVGLVLSAAGAGCGVSKPAVPPGGGGASGAGGTAGTMTACLDRPTELPRPPSGTLPCELLPPGYSR